MVREIWGEDKSTLGTGVGHQKTRWTVLASYNLAFEIPVPPETAASQWPKSRFVLAVVTR